MKATCDMQAPCQGRTQSYSSFCNRIAHYSVLGGKLPGIARIPRLVFTDVKSVCSTCTFPRRLSYSVLSSSYLRIFHTR